MPGAGLALASCLVPLAVYVWCLCPTIAAGDTGELITCAATLGVPHPPGYPTFTMLGKLFTLIPVGSVAWRVNLMSAVLCALACLMIYRAVAMLVRDDTAGLTAAWALAFSRFFWHYAEVAEVFALNNLMVALILEAIVRWRTSGRWDDARALGWIAFLCGLALTNQQTIVLLFPAVLYLLWATWPALLGKGRLLARCAGLFLLGLLPYAYVPLAAMRQPAICWDDPVTLEGFVRLLLRRDYGTLSLFSGGVEPSSGGVHLLAYASGLWEGYSVALVLVVIGMATAPRTVSAFLWLAFALTGPFFALIAHLPIEAKPLFLGVLHRFFIMSHVVIAVWLGYGAAWVGTRVGRLRAALPAIVAAVLLLWNFSQADFRANTLAYDLGRNVLSCMDRDALFFSHGDVVTMAVDYCQQVEGIRTDVKAIDLEKLTYPWYCAEVRRRFPDVTIPNERYDGVQTTSLSLVEANIARHPVIYTQSFKDEQYATRYTGVPNGLVLRIAPKGAPLDLNSLLAKNTELQGGYTIRGLDRPWPRTGFECEISQQYAFPYFTLGYTAGQAGRPDEAERLYREAIRIAPLYAPPHKNLAVLLMQRNPASPEVKSLFTTYLMLNPSDPQRGEILKVISPAR